MKVLVTGSEGFIGSHLVQHLLAKGHEVVAFVQYNSFGNIGWLEDIKARENSKVQLTFGDVRDFQIVKTAMSDCEAVIHLAALIAIPYSYHAPSSYIETNMNGTFNVLQSARELGIQRIIHTSTSEVYGTAIQVPISEAHPIQTQSPYSASKSAADMLAYAYYCSFELPVVTLRPFNVYGPRQSARAVIPSLVIQALSGRREIQVGNTSATREFNFATDTVAAFELALSARNIEGQTINIGNSHEVSIAGLIELIRELTGNDFSVAHDASRLRPEKSEVQRLVSDSRKAHDLLNWEPKYGGDLGFRTGLAETITWFSDQNNLRKYPDLGYNI